MKKISIIIIMTLFFYTISFSQQKDTRIETYLAELEKVGFSGTVLVALDGKKIISKGYGFRNLELRDCYEITYRFGSFFFPFSSLKF